MSAIETKVERGDNQMCMWNITLYHDWTDEKGVKHFHERKDVHAAIKVLSKKYAFQLERGAESGLLHYQIALDLKDKKRKGTLCKLLKEIYKFNNLLERHISPMSLAGVKGKQAFSYCMKDDHTRVEGPWTDKMDAFPRIKYLHDLVNKPDFKWKVWQETLISYSKDKSDGPLNRSVLVLIDLLGKLGKGTLSAEMKSQRYASLIPSHYKPSDISAFILSADLVDSNCFIFDIPRADSRINDPQFWMAIEHIKDGHFSDMRYKGRQETAPARPKVIIFMNEEPNLKMLSHDRWDLRMVGPGEKLYKYDRVKCKQIAAIVKKQRASVVHESKSNVEECPDIVEADFVNF